MAPIVAAYLKGEQSHFATIQQYLRPIVFAVLYSRRFRFNHNLQDDLEQECWIAVLQKLTYWDATRGSLKCFMYTCLTNRITSYFRNKDNDQHYLPVGNIEWYLANQEAKAIQPQELVLQLKTRLSGFIVNYVIRRVAIAIYLEVFDQQRNQLIQALGKMAGMPQPQMRFLVDYAVVVIKHYQWESL